MLCTIIGVGDGLGASLVRTFAMNGYDIAMIARTENVTHRLCEALQSGGRRAAAFEADSGNMEELDKAFRAIKTWGGDTDILIYNAAVMMPGIASELTPDRMMSEMNTNLAGALLAVRSSIEGMKARRRGTIILTGGGLALEPYPEWTSLAAGKAALRAYGLALHKEVAFDGVHVAVVAICGLIETGGQFDPQRIADVYWRIHAEPKGEFTREVVFLPEGADPYYNDPEGLYRNMSFPIQAMEA
jgi:short-subunit dehydrogenase